MRMFNCSGLKRRALAGLALLLLPGRAGFLPYDGPTGLEVGASAEASLHDPGRLSLPW